MGRPGEARPVMLQCRPAEEFSFGPRALKDALLSTDPALRQLYTATFSPAERLFLAEAYNPQRTLFGTLLIRTAFDWLLSRPEAPEDFQTFHAALPPRKQSLARKHIYLQPIGTCARGNLRPWEPVPPGNLRPMRTCGPWVPATVGTCGPWVPVTVGTCARGNLQPLGTCGRFLAGLLAPTLRHCPGWGLRGGGKGLSGADSAALPPDLSEGPAGSALLDQLRSCTEAFFLGLQVRCLPSVAATSIHCSSRPSQDPDRLQLHTGECVWRARADPRRPACSAVF